MRFSHEERHMKGRKQKDLMMKVLLTNYSRLVSGSMTQIVNNEGSIIQ